MLDVVDEDEATLELELERTLELELEVGEGDETDAALEVDDRTVEDVLWTELELDDVETMTELELELDGREEPFDPVPPAVPFLM